MTHDERVLQSPIPAGFGFLLLLLLLLLLLALRRQLIIGLLMASRDRGVYFFLVVHFFFVETVADELLRQTATPAPINQTPAS